MPKITGEEYDRNYNDEKSGRTDTVELKRRFLETRNTRGGTTSSCENEEYENSLRKSEVAELALESLQNIDDNFNDVTLILKGAASVGIIYLIPSAIKMTYKALLLSSLTISFLHENCTFPIVGAGVALGCLALQLASRYYCPDP